MLLYSCFSFAQNLVPNPGFEQYDTCPTSISQIHHATGWWSANETSDYYNICADTFCSVPRNLMGYQYPANGDAYAGYIHYNANSGREYLGVELLEELRNGKKYSIGFMINRSDGLNGGRVISNKMGMWFSNILYDSANPKLPDNFSHFKVDTFITDTANWISIAGIFDADSTYRYLYIGNFYDNEHTDTIETTLITNNRSYYFIDDIFVIEDTTTSQHEWNIKNIKSYYDNNNHLIIENARNMEIKVYNTEGVLQYENEKISTDKFLIDLINISYDLLIIIIISTSTIFYYRKIINPKK